MRRWSAVALVCAVSLAWPLCAASQVTVLCTTTIVGDIVRAVGSPVVSVTVLVPPGADPHAFQPAPGDVRAIEEADLVFLNGAGLEASLAPVLSAARGSVVDLSAGLALRTHEEGTEHTEGEDNHGAVDPHVWFDPQNVIGWVRIVTGALSAADLAHAEEFAARAAGYEAELIALDAWIRATVAELAPEARRLVTDHEALGYFAARYGFIQIGTVFPGMSTLAEPSARDRALLEDAIRAAAVRAVFVGTTVSAALAEQVAADTGARVVFLYTGSLSEPDGPAPTYLDLMRFDVRRIVDALAANGDP